VFVLPIESDLLVAASYLSSRGDNHHKTKPDKGFGGTELLKKSAAY
jgi:hypothetical protein